jgi:hypothetical protein
MVTELITLIVATTTLPSEFRPQTFVCKKIQSTWARPQSTPPAFGITYQNTEYLTQFADSATLDFELAKHCNNFNYKKIK